LNETEDKSGRPAETKEPRQFSSDELFRGARELIITHKNDQYRLRVTMSDKLILTK